MEYLILEQQSPRVLEELSRNKIDICSISESKKKGKGVVPYHQDYILFFSGVSNESRAKEGVALAIHKNLERTIDHHEYLSERIFYGIFKILSQVVPDKPRYLKMKPYLINSSF